MFENDQESKQFIEENAEKFPSIIPKILVNVRTDNILRSRGQDNIA